MTYVDPDGAPCSFFEWIGWRAATPPLRIGHLLALYVGCWIDDGTTPLPWHLEVASCGSTSGTLISQHRTKADALAAAAEQTLAKPVPYRRRAA